MNTLQEEHLGVVIVDDDRVFRELISAKILRESNFALFQAGTGDELFDVLAKERIDCLILDYDLGDDSGLAVKQRVEESAGQHPPTVMLTGDGRESTAIRAFRLGVHDYVSKKDLRPRALISSVLSVVERNRKELQAKAEHERLVAASAIDFVTGVEGRARLDERLSHLASLPARTRSAYAVILAQLEGYQDITEAVGLKGSDQVLRGFGQKLQGLVRSNDVCGRYARGEFLIIADVKADAGALEQICRRLSTQLSQEIQIGAARVRLSARVHGILCASLESLEAPNGSDWIATLLDHLSRARNASSAPETRPAAPSLPDTAPVSLPAADSLRGTERRREVRQRVFKRGLLYLVGAGGTFNCMVRNISSGGAGLRLDAAFAVPETCDLEIAGSGMRRRVAVRWQSGVDLGVEYVNKA